MDEGSSYSVLEERYQNILRFLNIDAKVQVSSEFVARNDLLQLEGRRRVLEKARERETNVR